MKARISLTCVLAVALGVMPFAGGCAQTAAQSVVATNSAETKVAAPTPTVLTPTTSAPAIASAPLTKPAVELAEPAAAAERPAPVKPVVEEPPPANLKVSPALREVIKMAKAGVGKEVLTAFVGESKERFVLGPEEIIYLNDLGVADDVTTAMIERDRVLRGDFDPAAVVASQPAAAPEPAPVAANPALYAPQYQAAAPIQAPQPEPMQTVATPDSDATYFYDSLAPYGNWVNVPSYGLCWQPTVGVSTPAWRPYLDGGRWVWSDSGWYWMSDYSWGWAPFHYGRWYYHGYHGWVWQPGRTWGPAWVSWRNSDAYCGWAPLPPEAGFVSGVGFTWYGGSAAVGCEFGLGWSSYAFVAVGDFCSYNPHHYVVHHDEHHDCWKNSKVVNKIKVKGDNNTVIVDADGKARVKVKGDDNNVAVDADGKAKVKTKGDGNDLIVDADGKARVKTHGDDNTVAVDTHGNAKVKTKGDDNDMTIDADGKTRVKVHGDDNTVAAEDHGDTKVKTKGDNNTVVFEGGADPKRVETASHQPIRRVSVREAAGESAQGRRGDRIAREGAEDVVYRSELPARASDRARTAVARVAAQSNLTPGSNSRSDRAPNNLKAVDARSIGANDRRPTSVAVAPPAATPAISTTRSSASGRIAADVRARQEPKGADSTMPLAEPSRRAATRTPESLVIRGNNATSARNANNSPGFQSNTPKSAPVAPTSAAPVAHADRTWANNQPTVEATVRPSDARSVRSGTTANVARPATPTPVTRATPIMEPYQIERVEPIRVWNTPLPQSAQPAQASQPAQPNQAVQPNANRNANAAPNAPFRNYAPTPATTPSSENYRSDRNSGVNDSRAARAQNNGAPSSQAPAPGPSYSAPERSRSESVRAERSGGGDSSVRSSGGGGGGGGGGGRNSGDDGGGNRSSGRNR